jgi:hypothetical protein
MSLMRRYSRRLAFSPRTGRGLNGRTHYINDNTPFVTTKYHGRALARVLAKESPTLMRWPSASRVQLTNYCLGAKDRHTYTNAEIEQATHFATAKRLPALRQFVMSKSLRA